LFEIRSRVEFGFRIGLYVIYVNSGPVAGPETSDGPCCTTWLGIHGFEAGIDICTWISVYTYMHSLTTTDL
jgi:hypothetical protein